MLTTHTQPLAGQLHSCLFETVAFAEPPAETARNSHNHRQKVISLHKTNSEENAKRDENHAKACADRQ